MSPPIAHVTVGFPRTEMMEMLEKSSTLNGFELYSMPKHWREKQIAKLDKFFILGAFLETGAIAPNQLLLFSDAYDVLVLERSEIVSRKFYRLNADLVFAAESNLWPDNDNRRSVFDRIDSKWRYLNSGCYIGYSWAVVELISYCVQRLRSQDFVGLREDDQWLAQEFYAVAQDRNDLCVKLDTEASIFACLHDSEADFGVDRDAVVRASNGLEVSILHANGDKRKVEILKRLWNLWHDNGTPAILDLRVCRLDEMLLCYDDNEKRLRLRPEITANTVVFVVNGRRRAVAFTCRDGCLTFTPDGRVYGDQVEVLAWEILQITGEITTHHGIKLAAYCEEGTEVEGHLAPLPLPALAMRLFKRLITYAGRYYPALQ